MESSSASTNSSFGSTASSSSPANVPTPSDSETDQVTIKQEPNVDVSDSHDRSVWAHIFDDTGAICLDVDDDDYPMDDEDIAADPRRSAPSVATGDVASGERDGAPELKPAIFPPHEHALPDRTPSSALLDNWSYYDHEMLSPSHQTHHDVSRAYDHPSAAITASTSRLPTSMEMTLHPRPPLDLAPLEPATSTTRTLGSSWASEAKTDSIPDQRRGEGQYDGVIATPSYLLTFEQQSNGQPLPLSKPIVRDDGLLIVGTELTPVNQSITSTSSSNRILVTKPGSSHGPQTITVDADVRDLQWLSHSTAIAAIGSDIHLLLLGGSEQSGTDQGEICTLAPAMRRIHADTIREIAVTHSSRTRVVSIASGGFDETVVLTTLGEGGDPQTATIDSKIDAYDVVSSLRWHPTQNGMLSWTTDGGDFQFADIRARTKPQLQVALNSFLEIDQMGGLFSHEYISQSNVMLGFQSGQLLFLDLRMPRKQYCYGVMTAPLSSVGEMRRSPTGTIALFGIGGFATAEVEPLGRELASMIGVRPPHSQTLGLSDYKTSGDFSFDTGSVFAVSDNLGVVSVYTTDTSSTTQGGSSNTSLQERAV